MRNLENKEKLWKESKTYSTVVIRKEYEEIFVFILSSDFVSCYCCVYRLAQGINYLTMMEKKKKKKK